MEKPSLDTAKAGALRFNTDSSQMEIYDGNQWTGILAELTPTLQTGGTRGFIAGGNGNTIDFFNVDVTSDAVDFGNLTETFFINKCSASRVRGLIHGDRPATTQIDFITIAQKGNGSDFGDLTVGREDCAGVSNGTRACFMGGGGNNVIDYVTIAHTGNAVDFGDQFLATNHGGSAESKTRGLVMNGANPGPDNTMQYITISTLGNSAEFGDTHQDGYGASGTSNSIRAVYNAGYNGSSHSNSIGFVNIATLGDGKDFGDLTEIKYAPGTCSSPTRGIFAGNYPTGSNVINYIQIMSTGNALDFGDLTSGRGHAGGSSNGHGGL